MKKVDTNLLLIGSILGAGWWIQGGIAELKIEMTEVKNENAQMWMDAKKDSDEKFYAQLKEIRNISERVAVMETKIQ